MGKNSSADWDFTTILGLGVTDISVSANSECVQIASTVAITHLQVSKYH